MRKEFGQLDGDQRLSDHLAPTACDGDIVVDGRAASSPLRDVCGQH